MSQLFEYGIQTEQSDYRAHVGFKSQHVIFFLTEAARQALQAGKYQAKTGGQAGVQGNTFKGYAVPYKLIAGYQEVRIPLDVWLELGCERLGRDASTSKKGMLAVHVVQAMLRCGKLVIPVIPDEVLDTDMQIQGFDILIRTGPRIQVKCDWLAGPIPCGGSGNVFLQTHERNPLKRY